MPEREIPSWLAGPHLNLTDRETGLILRLWKEGLSVYEASVEYWTDIKKLGVNPHEASRCSHKMSGLTKEGRVIVALSADRLWRNYYDQSAWAWMKFCIEHSKVESLQKLLPEVDDWGIDDKQ